MVPVERFICYIPNVSCKSQQLEKAIISVINVNNIEIKNCRGQSYDNVSNKYLLRITSKKKKNKLVSKL